MLFCIADSKNQGPDVMSMNIWDQWFAKIYNISGHGSISNAALYCARKVTHEQEPLDFHNKGQVSVDERLTFGKSLSNQEREASSERPPLAFIKVDTT